MSNFERINDLKKLKYITDSDNVAVEDLLLTDEDNHTFLDYIIKNNISINNFSLIEEISKNIDLLFYMFENNYFIETLPDVDLYFVEKNGKTLIEILFEKKSYLLSRIPLDAINRLYERVNGKYYVDELLKQNLCSEIISRMEDFETLYQHFIETNQLSQLKYCKKDFFLKLTPNGIPLVEELLNNKIPVDNQMDKRNHQLAEFFAQKQYYNELLKMDAEILLTYPSPQNNYLSILVQKYKDGEKIPFDHNRLNSKDNKSMAMAYIFLLKQNIPVLLPYNFEIISDYAYNNKKPVLIYMLEMDKELTLQYFNSDENKKSLVNYLKSLNKIPKDSELEFNGIDEALEYLPNKESLRKRIENKEITSFNKNDCFSEDLVEPMEDGLTIIDLLIQNGIKYTFDFNPSLKEILLALKYRRTITNVDEELLYADIGNNRKLIDLLIERKLFACIEFSINNDLRILDFCEKYNNYRFLPDSIFEILFNNQHGNFLAEKYLNDDNFIKAAGKYRNLSSKTKMLLYQKGYKKIMINASETELLTKTNGKTLLEELLDENLIPAFPGYSANSDEICQIFIRRGRIDLLHNISLNTLLNFPSKENNYLQLMIDTYKKGQNVNFEKVDYKSPNKEDIARCYILMARNGLVGFLKRLDESDFLLKDPITDKTLLYYLITIDKEISLRDIIKIDSLKDQDVFAELRLMGVNNGLNDLAIEQFDCDTLYRQIKKDEYAKGITSSTEDLLKELRDLFANDGKTEMKLIDSLITAYRYSISINPAFVDELVELIKIKKTNPEFYYIMEPKTGYFSKGSIKVEDDTIGTIVHETGHAMHSYLTGYEFPNDYAEVLKRINEDPTWLDRVDAYSKQFQKLREVVHKKAVDIVSHYITPEKANQNQENIVNLLSSKKEDIIKKYLEKGYTQETLELVLGESFSLQEFQEQKKKIEIAEVEDAIWRYDYDAFITIGDIIDAITTGKFKSNILKNADGEIIRSAFGHGIPYYYSDSPDTSYKMKFTEMVANYAALLKSKNNKEVLALLRSIIGDELFHLIDDFYREKIMNTSYKKESNITL